MTWEKRYRDAIREFMAEKGVPVEFSKRWETDPDDEVSIYGWTHSEARDHTAQCSDETVAKYPGRFDRCKWVVPEGAKLVERSYSQFIDTFTDNREEIGINVGPAHCSCGRYTDMTLRFVGSLAEVMQHITGTPKRAEIIL